MDLLLAIQVGLAVVLALLCLWLLRRVGREQRRFWWRRLGASRPADPARVRAALPAASKADRVSSAYHEPAITHPQNRDRPDDEPARR